MAIVCEDFNNLLESYSKTVPDHNMLFRVTKSCGYSQLVVVSKYDINKLGSHVALLQHQIGLQMGDWARDKVYFYAKTDTPFPSAEKTYVWQIYHPDIYRNDIPEELPEFALRVLPTAYTTKECRYTVYQLYIDTPCECGTHHSQPLHQRNTSMTPPPPPPASPITTPTIRMSTSMNDLDYIV
jgi:hypothetical protein